MATSTITIPGTDTKVPTPLVLIAGGVIVVILLLQKPAAEKQDTPDTTDTSSSGPSGFLTPVDQVTPGATPTPAGATNRPKKVPHADLLRLQTVDAYLNGDTPPDQNEIPNFVAKFIQGKSHQELLAKRQQLVTKLLSEGATPEQVA